MDFETKRSLADVLAVHGVRYQVHHAMIGTLPFSLYRYKRTGVHVTVYDSPGQTPNGSLGGPEGTHFLNLFEQVLDHFSPNILLTYGGNWVAKEIIARAKRRGIAIVFALHNLAYTDSSLFSTVDAVLVPSRFAKVHYKRCLGLDCTAIPGPWDWTAVRCPEIQGQYATFVNPEPAKGVFPFVRIASELGRVRPDIPLLVVEGRGQASWLQRTGHDLSKLSNLFVMKSTPDPRDFFRASRLILMPSLCQESFPRVAAEAMINGIPVLGSRRGGLPEVLDRAGFLLDMPERYTPESRQVPTAEEVGPWLETIIPLWDDAEFYGHQRQRCRAAAQVWRPERLGPQFEEFFVNVLGGLLAKANGHVALPNDDTKKNGAAFSKASCPAVPALTMVSPEVGGGPANASSSLTVSAGRHTNGTGGVKGARVSLCMIVKNEEANLAACLRPMIGSVHEMIVVDTGSTDRTREIAGQLGARVFDYAWTDSFAAARNEGLRHAVGDWIFWLDADDRMDGPNLGKLRAVFGNLSRENAAFVMQCFCSEAPGVREGTVVDHIRLFRNLPQIRWEYRVHEQILPAIRRLGVKVRSTDVVIRHVGYQDSCLRVRKQQRDRRLLELEHAEKPNDPFILFNLGWNYFTSRGAEHALPLLQRSLVLSKPTDSIVRKLYSLIASCHRRLGRPAAALSACLEGRHYYPDDASLLFQEAAVRREQRDFTGAGACLERLLHGKDQPHFASAVCGLRGIKAQHELALLYRDQGREKEAEQQWRTALIDHPNAVSAWYGLGGLCLKQGRVSEAEDVLRQLARAEAFRSAGPVLTSGLRARLHLARREYATARQVLEEALSQFSQEVLLWLILSQVLLRQEGGSEAAEKALRTVLELDPANAEAAHNLAVLLRDREKLATLIPALQEL
jgi:tetratricopeptide (TPR) repeat protein/glycosyltransferase involved in cell wall biosynthesis